MMRERKVNRWIRKWQRLFLLDHWDIYYSEAEKRDSEPSLLAEINIRTRYMEADLQIFPYFWEAVGDYGTDKYREETVAHELAHIIVSPLVQLIERARAGQLVTEANMNDAQEEATESISRIATRLRAQALAVVNK